MRTTASILVLSAVAACVAIVQLAGSTTTATSPQTAESQDAAETAGSNAVQAIQRRPLGTRHLPPSPQPFRGVIKRNEADSTPAWQTTTTPPKGAPNVLLIMTDDVGFAASSTFGGTIPTPTFDRLAKQGLRYNTFCSTSLCSPSRAALLTGRNHHTAHTGVVIDSSTGFPGYDSQMDRDTATIAATLRQNGYTTAWFGKDHNIPTWQQSSVGPFDLWPNALGFDYFYGFVGGDTNQWRPNVYRNTTPIEPYVDNPDYNFNIAMADEAIAWVTQQKAVAPEKPFFLYYAPGATHAPHHPTPEWIAKFKGKFDHGWNVERERIFANQKRLGVIPESAKLTPWPDDLDRWEQLDADQKRLFTRMMEVYAAYLAETDYQIGRVIDAVERTGELDNTLVIYIQGDNGASAEGGLEGTINEVAAFNGVQFSVEEMLPFIDELGSDQTYNHFPVGWAYSMSTPFRWFKQVAAYFGGTRQGMVMVWPGHIDDAGQLRTQFHHLIDIAPTILDAAGIEQPVAVDGVTQRPMEGVSMTYTFQAANADTPSRHTTQYFEMAGSRALYHEGWIASTKVTSPPWNIMGAPSRDPADDAVWELYNLAEDFSQFENVAAKYPKKLEQLQDLFWIEAAKYNVLPLDDRGMPDRFLTPRPGVTDGRTLFDFPDGVTRVPSGSAPDVKNRSFTVQATFETSGSTDAEGMLITLGGRFGGYGLYLLSGRPVFVYNYLDKERTRFEGPPLPPGAHDVSFVFHYDGDGVGKGGVGELIVDGRTVDQKRIERTIPLKFTQGESQDVGRDTGTPVSDDYHIPFKFSGSNLNTLIRLEP